MDRRRLLLRAALGFVTLPLPPGDDALAALYRYLDSWQGVGVIATGMARQACDLRLTRYADRGWRANFYPSGLAHSIVKGTGWAETPWRAVQQAAWEALARDTDLP